MARISDFRSGTGAFDRQDGRDAQDDEEAALPCSDKLVFDSQRQAAAAANVAEYQHGAQLRPYVCRHCGLWHLSSA